MSDRRDRADPPVWGRLGSGASVGRRPADLDLVLPEQLRSRAVASAGSGELILPYAETLEAIDAATKHGIAVLGAESFEIRGDGTVRALSYSEYEFQSEPDWRAFVGQNNDAAERWVREHRLGENHGYILTSASQKEFASLKERRSP